MFDDKGQDYCSFKPTITAKAKIREAIASHPAISEGHSKLDEALSRWWTGARLAIEALPHHNHVAKFRRESIEQLKKQFPAFTLLDEFQVAGLFVNWWEMVRWDMKTIVASGWAPSLIPDEYIKNSFLKSELDGLEMLDAKVAGLESDLAEQLDDIEMEENGEDNNGKTLKTVKSFLKDE